MAQNNFLIEIQPKKTSSNEMLVSTAHKLGLSKITGINVARVFFILGDITHDDVSRISQELLANPVTEKFTIYQNFGEKIQNDDYDQIDVTFIPGVTDTEAESLHNAVKTLGIQGEMQAATGTRYFVTGELNNDDLHLLAQRMLANATIQRYQINEVPHPPLMGDLQLKRIVETIAIQNVDDDGLMQISKERMLSLNLEEMQAIRSYYQSEQRDPTDVELEMLAQTWSEHCVHKTFKAHIKYNGPLPSASPDSPPVEQEIHGLLNLIQQATTDVNKDWIRSAFVDNAGIIKFTDELDIAFKVETHNHPSAIEPFGGANTGVGGVIRDVLGVSAEPIANTDVLCFGPQDLDPDQLPTGALHPRIIQDGVVHGIEDYGNKMGIPTVNGSVFYDAGYTANPLVYCGCLGILPTGSNPTQPQPNDLIVVIGGKTGRDGLRGATFSSMEMDGSTGEVAGSSVQIGHAINEKQVREVIVRARDEKLYNAITDCGAGGLSSAVGEMGEHIGAEVQLENVPLKYAGLQPWEIWLSEAQERMVLAVSPENWDRIQEICASQDVTVVSIGTYKPTGRLTLYYEDDVVGDLAMEFLHDGIPTHHLTAVWSKPEIATEAIVSETNINDTLLKLLAHPNIRSKEDIVRRYDHEVQGGTVVKPYLGIDEIGPSDATVLAPMALQAKNDYRAIALSNGICPQFTDLDPYVMTWAAIDEAMRNIVAVGTDPSTVAILDNFCWGNPNLPDRLGTLVRSVQACYDAAVAYDVPFISGKDSLNNEYLDTDGERHAIPGTLLISAVGTVPDINRAVTMDFKGEDNDIYVIGTTEKAFAGSHYHLLSGEIAGELPSIPQNTLQMYKALHQAMNEGLILACHDCSEGGLAVALAEMCMASNKGAFIELGDQKRTNDLSEAEFLFSESLSRFVVEVSPDNHERFIEIMSDHPVTYIGEVGGKQLNIRGAANRLVCDLFIDELTEAWLPTQPLVGASAEVEINDTPPTLTSHRDRISVDTSRRPKVAILHANGTNRDHDAEIACAQAGGDPEIIHVNQLMSGKKSLLDYNMLVVPGGFSYGDDLGAGVLWALDLRERFYDQLSTFIEDGRPTIGICNGFQTLVKSGFLPDSNLPVTLTYNQSGHFECRWVYLEPNPYSTSLFTHNIEGLIYCPVAHGEGRVAVDSDQTAQELWDEGLIALRYVDEKGDVAGYPINPNGSVMNIAGLNNRNGNVFGLMPHPENHIFSYQHPRWTKHNDKNSADNILLGLELFKNGIKFA